MDIEMSKKLDDFVKQTFDPEKIIISVRFKKYELKWEKLESLPQSRLGKIRFATCMEEIKELCDEVYVDRNEIYFDRSPRAFESIVDYHYSSYLHMDSNCCVILLNADLKYWKIDSFDFATCCNYKFHQLREDALDHIVKMKVIEHGITHKTISNSSNHSCCPKIRKKCWEITENTSSSIYAKVFTFTSIFFIMISTLTLVLSSLIDDKAKINQVFNGTIIGDNFYPIFELIEGIYLGWFTLEFALRFWAAPNQIEFLKDVLNIIDLISIVPLYVSIIMHSLPQNIIIQTKAFSRIFKIFRVARICRIFRLARHSESLKSLGKTVKMSMNEFGILFMFLAFAVLLFSDLVYFAEKDEENTEFTSIPATFWWAVITITTVGYGDMVPVTSMGRFIGILCCISGVLVLAMPISIIIDNFRKISYNEKVNVKSQQYMKQRKILQDKRDNYSIIDCENT